MAVLAGAVSKRRIKQSADPPVRSSNPLGMGLGTAISFKSRASDWLPGRKSQASTHRGGPRCDLRILCQSLAFSSCADLERDGNGVLGRGSRCRDLRGTDVGSGRRAYDSR